MPPAGAALSGSLASNAIVLIAVVIMPVAKIKPVQRLKILLWARTPDNPRTPLFLPNKNNSLQGAKSGSNIPLNILGGYRWPDAPRVDSETLERIRHLEVAALVEAVK